MDDDIDPENPPALPDWAESYLAEQRQWWQLLRSAGAVSDADALAELQRWTEHH